jgi:hypothetical protein
VATIQPPNATQWQVGDYVIHHANARRADVLMVVLGLSASGTYRPRYAYPAEPPKIWQHTVWRNTIESLQGPRRFGIAAPAIKPGDRASTEPRQPLSRPAPDPIATL